MDLTGKTAVITWLFFYFFTPFLGLSKTCSRAEKKGIFLLFLLDFLNEFD